MGGSIRVAGFDVFEDPIEVKKRIGYLPENPPVYGEMPAWMSVIAVLALSAYLALHPALAAWLWL